MCRFFLRSLQIVLICCVSIASFGQNDSIRWLDEVTISGMNLSRFSSGTQLQSISSSSQGGINNIGDLTTIHFKNYGNQQLSSISFRGTSANHTNVVWNGIQVNSPTLGQTDFSVWPMFLTDQVVIQYGGGSSLFGSGSIGGSVILDNSTIRSDSLLTIYSAIGSFGQYDGGLKLQVDASDRLILETRAFRGVLNNDFPLERGGRQEHATVRRHAVSQKIGYTHRHGYLFAEVAYASNDREIQPTITSAQRNTLVSNNFRSVVSNEWQKGSGIHFTSAGLVSDQTIYNDSSETTSYRFSGNYTFEKGEGALLLLRAGGTFIHEWATSENYVEVEKEEQYHIFGSATLFPIPNLSVTLNLREAIHSVDHVFLPSLGAEYVLVRQSKHSLTARTQVSRDYRIPTFNDLHYQPGGNTDLAPEESVNVEAGLDWEHPMGQIAITGFTSNITNWIQWRQTEGIWSPENLRQVTTKGIEARGNISKNYGAVGLQFESAYTFVLSEDQGLNRTNQLPYVPKHEIFGLFTSIYKRYVATVVGNFTSVRYATLTNSRPSEIDEFFLLDASLLRMFSLSDLSLSIRAQAKNILNTNYQVVKNHAMPGRSFLIELSTKF